MSVAARRIKKQSKIANLIWRRGWDSNPRNGSPFTAFPVLPIQPLLHLSGIADWSVRTRARFLQQADRQSSIGNDMAESVGFAPTVAVKPLRFSRPGH